MPATLAETTKRLLADLPPFEQDSKDIQGTLDVIAREVDRIDAARLNVIENFFPQTADDFMAIHEATYGLGVNPVDKTLSMRQQAAVAYARKLKGTGTGLDWQAALTALIGTSWSYEEYDPADGTSPAPNVLRITIPFLATVATPAAPTGTAGAGGTFAAGTYYWGITATNFYGETPVSPTLSKTLTLNQQLPLTWSAVSGAAGYNIYRGTSAGALLRVASVTTNAYTDTGTAAVGGAPPSTNTTTSPQAYEAASLARAITPAHIELNFVYGVGFVVGYSALGDPL